MVLLNLIVFFSVQLETINVQIEKFFYDNKIYFLYFREFLEIYPLYFRVFLEIYSLYFREFLDIYSLYFRVFLA